MLDLKHSAIAFMTMRDELTYDCKNLNGPTFNLTTGKVETFRTPLIGASPIREPTAARIRSSCRCSMIRTG